MKFTPQVEQIRKSLPPGIEIRPFYDQSIIVGDSIKSVRDAILLGLILASIILVVFLRDWGTSIVAGLVIPVTVLVTFVALKLLDQSFNLMTLGGLAAAVGLVIDDAIVVVENIVLHRDAGEGRLQAIHSALQEITVPLIGSTVTPVVVFLPLISITGVTGTFFRALAVTMGVSLFTSLALALTWTPNLSQYFIRGKGTRRRKTAYRSADESITDCWPPKKLPWADSSARSSTSMSAGCSGRWPVRGGWRRLSLVLMAASYVCYRYSGSDLMPEMDEGGFTLDYLTPAGTSLAETDRMVGHIEQILNSVPEVESTSRRTGLELGLAAVTEANRGDILVKLKKDRSRGIDDVMEDVRAKVTAQEPAVRVEFVQVLQDMIGDLTSEPEPIQIKLFSQDPALLQTWAPKVAEAIGKIPGVVDVLDGIENTISGPAITFQVNPSVAARAGFTPEEIATDAAAILEGEPAATPVVSNDRRLHRAGALPCREPRFTRGHPRHPADQQQRQDCDSRRAGHDYRTPTANRNSPRKSAARRFRNRAAGRHRPGQRHRGGAEGGGRAAFAVQHSRGVWRHLQTGTEVISRPGIRTDSGDCSRVHRAAF